MICKDCIHHELCSELGLFSHLNKEYYHFGLDCKYAKDKSQCLELPNGYKPRFYIEREKSVGYKAVRQVNFTEVWIEPTYDKAVKMLEELRNGL